MQSFDCLAESLVLGRELLLDGFGGFGALPLVLGASFGQLAPLGRR